MKKRIQVSINPVLVERAERLMLLRCHDSFSELLESLIREAWGAAAVGAGAAAGAESEPITPQRAQAALDTAVGEMSAELRKLRKAHKTSDKLNKTPPLSH